jgi:hypothetical protein
MSDFIKEITEITERYKREIDALREKYVKTLEKLNSEATKSQTGDLKKKIEEPGPSYFS